MGPKQTYLGGGQKEKDRKSPDKKRCKKRSRYGRGGGGREIDSG